ncbi:hypothetical protein BJX70DRAFT_263540 [Aspergillus crustosus]
MLLIIYSSRGGMAMMMFVSSCFILFHLFPIYSSLARLAYSHVHGLRLHDVCITLHVFLPAGTEDGRCIVDSHCSGALVSRRAETEAVMVAAVMVMVIFAFEFRELDLHIIAYDEVQLGSRSASEVT